MKHSIAQITEQLRNEPEKGFRMLVDSFMEPVYNHVRRLVVNHDDAQDVVQESFVKVYNALPSLRDLKTLPSWIMKIATNEALLFLRSEKARTAADMLQPEAADSLEADEYFDYSDLEAVKLQRAIHTLPPKQQAVFNLKYFDDLPYDEIGRITGTTSLTAKVNYHFAKKKITELLSADI